MKKIYRNRLPKGLEPLCSTVYFDNGEVIVNVEFKDKFEPKNGDFLSTKDGRVFIYNNKYTSVQYGAYCGIDIYNNIIISDSPLLPGWTGKYGCRYATHEEKASFLERLKKEYGKKWNEETKQLEDIRWRVNLGEKYWYITETSVLEDDELASSDDDVRYKNKNYFRTPESAQKVADQIKEIFKNSKAE